MIRIVHNNTDILEFENFEQSVNFTNWIQKNFQNFQITPIISRNKLSKKKLKFENQYDFDSYSKLIEDEPHSLFSEFQNLKKWKSSFKDLPLI